MKKSKMITGTKTVWEDGKYVPKVIPLGKKILLDIPETTAGGIVINQGAQIQEQGVILAIGPEVTDFLSVKVGDIIQFKAWSVDIVTVGDEKNYYISADSDAICGLITKK